ncbi:Hypothetical predicted protein [Lynx pardinus]|uniref:Uncharacterized protein n=1 Tax=Lynx pardinus TaxID=191816 RepID=A0A485N3F1_LYNPA|nr:Hypothetical predicted protein [Lynx pardinus]
MPAAHRNACGTLLLPVPQDCGQVPAAPEKFVRQCSSSISGIMENHNTHPAPGFTLKDLVPAPANVAVFWAGTRWLQQSLPNVLPAVEPLFPVWPENLLDPTLFLRILPSHQSTTRYGAAELQPLRSLCLQS